MMTDYTVEGKGVMSLKFFNKRFSFMLPEKLVDLLRIEAIEEVGGIPYIRFDITQKISKEQKLHIHKFVFTNPLTQEEFVIDCLLPPN